MAKVLLTSAGPRDGDTYHRLRELQPLDRFGEHVLTADPEQADLILFVESWGAGPFLEATRRHPYVRRYRRKCFCFEEQGTMVPFLPGVYTHLEKRWYMKERERSGFYLSKFENKFASFTPPTGEEPLLYSFVGSFFTHPVRPHLGALSHPRSLVIDSSAYALQVWYEGSPEEKEQFWRQYADASRQSKFVLCPAGQSPPSVRLFDTMKMGRVPVVISDQWVPPEGPDWEACILRVSERDVPRIPKLLEAWEDRSVRMGLAARGQWEEWYSPEVCFHRIVEWCLQIQQEQGMPRWMLRAKPYVQLLSPSVLRHYLRTRRELYREQGRLVF